MTHPSKKLSKKYLRPYEIIAQSSLQSFTLCLPDTMRAVHLVFHVSMLKLAIPNTFLQHSKLPPAPVIIDGEPEYKISKIVNSKIDCWRACKLLYKIIWLGYEDTNNDSKWLLAMELEHAKELLSDFHLNYPSKPGPLRLWKCFHFTSLPLPLCTHTIKKKKKDFEYLYTFWSAVSFALTYLLVFCSTVFVAIWYLYSEAVSIAENLRICIPLCSPPLWSSNTCIFASSFIITYNHFLPTETEKIIFIKIKRKTLQSSGANRVHDWRETITALFHTLYFIFLFLLSNFFLLLCSVYPLLLLFSLFLVALHLCFLSLGLRP